MHKCGKLDNVSFSFGETKFQLDANREHGAKYTLEYTLILKGATKPLKETHRALQIITHEDLFRFSLSQNFSILSEILPKPVSNFKTKQQWFCPVQKWLIHLLVLLLSY